MNYSSTKNYGFLSLCYHYIRNDNNDPFPRILGTKISEFEKQIKMLKENFEIISLKDTSEFYSEKFEFYNNHGMLITFDDGLSDHYKAAKILFDNNIKSIFFVPTCILKDETPANPMIIHYSLAIHGIQNFLDSLQNSLKFFGLSTNEFKIIFNKNNDNVWNKISEIKSFFKYKLNYKISRQILLHIYQTLLLPDFPDLLTKIHLQKEQIKDMIEMGHTIGTHTHTHISVGAANLPNDDFYNEIIYPKNYLENEFNIPVTSFSYPFGQQNDVLSSNNLLKKTKEFQLAFTVEEILNNDSSSNLEIGRYQPKSTETILSLKKTLFDIIKKSEL